MRKLRPMKRVKVVNYETLNDEIEDLKQSIKKIKISIKYKERELDKLWFQERTLPPIYDGKSYKTYLIKENNTSFYKIGKSTNPTLREKTLQRQMPNIHIVKIWDKDIEKTLHKKYKQQRVRGEWFKLTKVQVRHICTFY